MNRVKKLLISFVILHHQLNFIEVRENDGDESDRRFHFVEEKSTTERRERQHDFGKCFLGTTEVTVMLPNYERQNHQKIVAILDWIAKEPCINVSVFNDLPEKMIQWQKGNFQEHEILEELIPSTTKLIQFIRNLRHIFKFPETRNNNNNNNNNNRTRKILLIHDFFEYDWNKTRRLEEVESLHLETDWKVVITCSPVKCPVSSQIPINRILPVRNPNDLREIYKVIHLIRNPDFDKFKFLKYLALNDEHIKELSCLNNQTVLNIDIGKPSLELLEMLAPVLSKIKARVDKVILFFVASETEEAWCDRNRGCMGRSFLDRTFWINYIVDNKLSSKENIFVAKFRKRIEGVHEIHWTINRQGILNITEVCG